MNPNAVQRLCELLDTTICDASSDLDNELGVIHRFGMRSIPYRYVPALVKSPPYSATTRYIAQSLRMIPAALTGKG